MPDRPAKAPPIPPRPGLRVLEDTVPWAGRFPVQKVRFTYTRFDGTPSRELTWELWRRGPAVALLPYDPWADAVCLIEQFRLPAHAAGFPPVMVECVAGLLEPGEDPEDAARRECAEECGLSQDTLEPIAHTMLMQGGCDESIHIFCGRVRLGTAPAGTHGLAAEGEDIRPLHLPAADAFARLDAGGIHNAVATVALWWLRHHRERLRRDWT